MKPYVASLLFILGLAAPVTYGQPGGTRANVNATPAGNANVSVNAPASPSPTPTSKANDNSNANSGNTNNANRTQNDNSGTVGTTGNTNTSVNGNVKAGPSPSNNPSTPQPSSWILFMLGAIGALLTVYLAKQQVIPEFRAFFDTTAEELEAQVHRDHLISTRNELDEVKGILKKTDSPTTLSTEDIDRLKTVVTSSEAEINTEQTRLQAIERRIMWSQILSRGFGFIFYVVIGGVLAWLLTREKIAVLDHFSIYVQAVIIGATWISYLSLIGIKTGQEQADKKIEDSTNKVASAIDSLKQKVTSTLSAGNQGASVANPSLANQLAETIDQTGADLAGHLNMTRAMVRKDMRGIL